MWGWWGTAMEWTPRASRRCFTVSVLSLEARCSPGRVSSTSSCRPRPRSRETHTQLRTHALFPAISWPRRTDPAVNERIRLSNRQVAWLQKYRLVHARTYLVSLLFDIPGSPLFQRSLKSGHQRWHMRVARHYAGRCLRSLCAGQPVAMISCGHLQPRCMEWTCLRPRLPRCNRFRSVQSCFSHVSVMLKHVKSC